MQILLLIVYVLNSSDLFFTRHWAKKFGLDIELNPLGRWFLESDLRQVIFKVILPAIALTILYVFRDRKIAKISSWIVLAIYAMLTIYHIYLFFKIGGIMK